MSGRSASVVFVFDGVYAAAGGPEIVRGIDLVKSQSALMRGDAPGSPAVPPFDLTRLPRRGGDLGQDPVGKRSVGNGTFLGHAAFGVVHRQPIHEELGVNDRVRGPIRRRREQSQIGSGRRREAHAVQHRIGARVQRGIGRGSRLADIGGSDRKQIQGASLSRGGAGTGSPSYVYHLSSQDADMGIGHQWLFKTSYRAFLKMPPFGMRLRNAVDID